MTEPDGMPILAYQLIACLTNSTRTATHPIGQYARGSSGTEYRISPRGFGFRPMNQHTGPMLNGYPTSTTTIIARAVRFAHRSRRLTIRTARHRKSLLREGHPSNCQHDGHTGIVAGRGRVKEDCLRLRCQPRTAYSNLTDTSAKAIIYSAAFGRNQINFISCVSCISWLSSIERFERRDHETHEIHETFQPKVIHRFRRFSQIRSSLSVLSV